MSTAWHCDGPGCDTWRRTASRLPDDWLHVTQEGNQSRDFCAPDCLIKYYAKFDPTEVIAA